MLLRPFLWGQILSQVVFSPCLKVCASFPLTFLGSLLFLGAYMGVQEWIALGEILGS